MKTWWFPHFQSTASVTTFRAEIGHATDATQLLGILIKALEAEFPNIAERLQLTNETNEKVDTLTKLFMGIDRAALSSKIRSISEVQEKQEQAIELYEQLRKQIESFMNQTQSDPDPLNRPNLIQNLLKDCDRIIMEAFPGIDRDLRAKTESTAPRPN